MARSCTHGAEGRIPRRDLFPLGPREEEVQGRARLRLSVRLGVISDTHGMVRPEVFDVFREVDHILHGGDVGEWGVVLELQSVAPVTAVYGNTDDLELRSKLPQVAEIELVDKTVTVMNPGGAGAPRFGLLPSVGILELEPGIPPRGRIVGLGGK